MYKEKKKGNRKVFWTGLLAGLVLLCIILVPVCRRAARDMDEQSTSSVQEAVIRSAVQCYAVEGAYPNNLTYLEEHYGLVINHDRYIVSYECYASNLAPNVRVLVRGSESNGERRP